MKKVLLSVLALLAYACIGSAQNLPSYVPANGLVGWWPFNGNANDESGNNNNGTVNGATLTTDRFGNAGKAYDFDGVNDWIQVQNDTSLNFSNDISISSWFKSDSFNLVSMIFSKHSPVCDNNVGTFVYGIWDDGGIGDYKINFSASPVFSDATYPNNNALVSVNLWYNFIATYSNSSQVLKYYLNGVLVDSINVDFNILNNNFDVFIGKQDCSNTWHFNGSIDDIAIYNRALSQQEITALYQGANTTSNCLNLPSNLQQGLVGYWPFCGNALDESGNGNHGTVNGATLTSDRFGNAGSAYGFDGVDDYIQVPFDSALNPKRPFSISFFGLTNTPTVSQTWVSTNPFGVFKGWDLMPFQGGGMNYEVAVNNQWYSFQTNYLYPQNTWINSTFIFGEDSIRVYLNGVHFRTSYLPLGDISYGENLPLMMGSTVTGQHWLNGKIDDVAIWNRALSQQEITQLYNQGICQTSITVTDTLLIHTGITSYNPVAYQNTLKVWPNPGNQDITLDAGNLSLMQGWKIKISNSLGQEVYPATLISQQQQVLDMSTWGGNGLYFLHLINPQGHITEVKKIVLAP